LRSRALLNLYIRAADLVITVSEFSKEELVRYLGISPDKIRVTYEAPDERLVQPRSPEYIRGVRAKYGIPDCFVLFVGGYDKRKNVSALLRAFAALTTTHPDVGLVLVGIGGDIEDSRLQCRVLGMAEGRHVFFLERLSDPELGALYQAASLFATMSWHEGFCLPLAEAMACGAPVLASRFGAIPEILGGAGRLVDPRKVDEIADAMRTILREADLRSEMRARSLSRSSAFTWERTAEQTLEVYEELYRRCA
jgi:glycosyltransferase involved in cell wall biosynthesis